MMKVLTVRMSERLHQHLALAAEQEGISSAQFVREAVIARMAFMRATYSPGDINSLYKAMREMQEEGLI